MKHRDRTPACLTLASILVAGTMAIAQSPAHKAIVAKDGAQRASEFDDAIRVNIRPDLRRKLAPIVAAIRYSENGGPGREYGILHPRVGDSYRSQAGWCAATVQKCYDRWVRKGKPSFFVGFLGSRYCPIGAENDPTGLNRHWVRNVSRFAYKFWDYTVDCGK